MSNATMSWSRRIGVGAVVCIFGGVLGASFGASVAHAACKDKRNCITTYGIDPPCPDCEPNEWACGDRAVAVGLAFEVIDVSRYDGYSDYTYFTEHEKSCYVSYDCDLDLEDPCDRDENNELDDDAFKCIQDEDSMTVVWGYDNGIFTDPCG